MKRRIRIPGFPEGLEVEIGPVAPVYIEPPALKDEQCRTTVKGIQCVHGQGHSGECEYFSVLGPNKRRRVLRLDGSMPIPEPPPPKPYQYLVDCFSCGLQKQGDLGYKCGRCRSWGAGIHTLTLKASKAIDAADELVKVADEIVKTIDNEWDNGVMQEEDKRKMMRAVTTYLHARYGASK